METYQTTVDLRVESLEDVKCVFECTICGLGPGLNDILNLWTVCSCYLLAPGGLKPSETSPFREGYLSQVESTESFE